MSHALLSLRHRFASWFGSRSKHRLRPVIKNSAPVLELLEERCVLTSPTVQTGGVLTNSANLTHLYSFNSSLTDQYGGPTLLSDGGNLSGGRYSFNANQGVRLNGGLANTSNYSIELVMRYNVLGGTTSAFKKFIDFAQRSSDSGMYVKRTPAINADVVVFYPGASGTGVVTAGVDFHFVLTRSATGVTTIYLNGVLQATYASGSTPSNAAVPPNNVLTFFEDDGGGEAGAGSADYIAIYDGPLNSTDVVALYQATSQTPPNAITVNEGQTAVMSGVYHDPGATSVTITSSIPNTITQPTAGPHGTWSWSFAATDGPAQSQTVVITATDNNGATATTNFQLTVNNVTPTASFGNSGPVSEGSTALVSFANQVEPSSVDAQTLHYAYDFDNDGVFEIGDGTYVNSVPSASATVPASFLADGPATRTVHGRILDKDGAFSDYTTTIVINNAPPTLTVDSEIVTVDEGETATNAGAFGDPGPDIVSVTASFGAFSAANGVWSWFFATSDGPQQSQTVTLTATDSHGAVTTRNFELVVRNRAPHAAANGASVTVNEGQTAAISGTFGDPGVDTVSLSASVGTVVDNGDGTWSWSFDSSDGPDQSQTVTITATDSDGDETSATFNLVVNNINPTITSVSSSATSSNPGQPGTPVTVLGAFGDPGTADTHHAVIAWGDSTQTTINENDPGIDQTANTLSASHAYGAAGTYTVTVTVYDDDGGSVVVSTTAVIQSDSTGAGTVTVKDGVLYVTGTDGDDHVTINKLNDSTIKVHADFLNGSSFVTFDLSGITMIVVDLGAGDDFFSIAGNITLPVIVLGGAGIDNLSGGAGPAALVGGGNCDNLSGGKGRDLLIGGDGDDRLHGSDRDDLFIHDCTKGDNDVNALIAALRAWNAAADRAAGAAAVNALFATLGTTVTQPSSGGNAVVPPAVSRGNSAAHTKRGQHRRPTKVAKKHQPPTLVHSKNKKGDTHSSKSLTKRSPARGKRK